MLGKSGLLNSHPHRQSLYGTLFKTLTCLAVDLGFILRLKCKWHGQVHYCTFIIWIEISPFEGECDMTNQISSSPASKVSNLVIKLCGFTNITLIHVELGLGP